MSGKKNKQKWILLSILFLVAAIGATTIIYMDRIREFLPNDDGAISLTDETGNGSEDADDTEDGIEETLPKADETEESSNRNENENNQQQTPVYHPASETSDPEQIWKKETDVEIFKTSYVNGQQEITVQSGNGDKIVAPGTENSYTFKLKNTGNVALDYEVNLDFYTGMSNAKIPLECRVHRYDGTWIAGEEDEWVSIDQLNDVVDNHTVGSGRYTTYTFDWRWPFEAGSDAYDTTLGNTALEQDVTLTLEINTRAEISGNPEAIDGIIPRTGDNSNVTLYVLLMTGAILMILILLWFREREEEQMYE